MDRPPRTGIRPALLARVREDDGIGLILVIGITAFVTALAFTAAVIAVNGLGLSRQRTAYEQSLAAAETGVDFTLARVQKAWDDWAADYPIPSDKGPGNTTPWCSGDAVVAPTTFSSASAERTWARSELATLATNNPNCIQTTSSGQWLVFKPQTALVNGLYPRSGTIYSIGWSPSYAHPTSTRIIKTQYILMPYRPTNAILTGGDLTIDGSASVTTVPGADPTLASIHANGTVLTSNGNPTATGVVSSTGSSSASSTRFSANPGGAVTQSQTQPVPTVSALDFYRHAMYNDPAPIVAGTWFDLCPDGTVHPYDSTTFTPCANPTTLGNGINGSSYNGWSYTTTTHLWTASQDTVSGVYFAYQADVNNGVGNAVIPNLTVIAAASNPTDCSSKQYGNITWDHYNIAAPAFTNLFFYADSDLLTTSNVVYGSSTSSPIVSGMFIAGDQMHLETGSQSAVGAAIAADQCSTSPLVTSNQAKNLSIYYDPSSDTPFTSIVTTTLWAEFPGTG